MKSPIRLPLAILAASTLLAFTPSAHAQVITQNTLTGFDASDSYAISVPGDFFAITQTFTGLLSVDTITYRFVTADLAIAAQSLSYTFQEWTPAGDTSIGAALISNPFVTAAFGSWDFSDGTHGFLDVEFDLSLVPAASGLDAGKTYGFSILSGGIGPTGDIRVANVADGLLPAWTGFGHIDPGGYDYGVLAGGSSTSSFDVGFDFVGTGLTPVPEASTAAVLFSGLFAGTMVFVRTRRPRSTVVTNATA